MLEIAAWPKDDRRDLFLEVSARRGLSFDVVQKDFWVCFALDRLFRGADLGNAMYFKGGTSLSKCFELIERFSEDIDLTIDRASLGFSHDFLEVPGRKELKKRRKEIRARAQDFVSSTVFPAFRTSVGDVIGEPEAWELNDDGAGTIFFVFPADAEVTRADYLRAEVKLEIGGLSDLDPHETASVRSYAAEVFPDVFAQPDVDVQVISARRTMCDKLLLLHRLNTTDKALRVGDSRHFYDVSRMAQRPVRQELFRSPALLSGAIDYEAKTFPRTGIDYTELKPARLKLIPPEALQPSLAGDYRAMREMFFVEPPDLEAVLSTLAELEIALREL